MRNLPYFIFWLALRAIIPSKHGLKASRMRQGERSYKCLIDDNASSEIISMFFMILLMIAMSGIYLIIVYTQVTEMIP